MMTPAVAEGVEAAIIKAVYDAAFAEVVDKIREMTGEKRSRILRSAADDVLRDALGTGRIQYADGVFSGRFSASVSKAIQRLGASWDGRSRVFRLAPAKVPSWVSAAAAARMVDVKTAHESMLKALDKAIETLDMKVERTQVNSPLVLGAVERDFKRDASRLDIGVPELSEEGRLNLAEDYTRNVKLRIKEWSRQAVTDLRAAVQENAEQGYRFDRLAAKVGERYAVSQSKARFLARQETSLFMSKFRRERFADAGVRLYRWSTSRDERVRDDHKHLNGKVFSYAEPPVVDASTGRRANPGEDFNCRCVDVPILRAVEKAA